MYHVEEYHYTSSFNLEAYLNQSREQGLELVSFDGFIFVFLRREQTTRDLRDLFFAKREPLVNVGVAE